MLRHHPIRKSLLLAGAALLVVAQAPGFDVVLDPSDVAKSLAEIERLSQTSRTAAGEKAQLDALYNMGDRVLDLVDLMNKDRYSHGTVDPSLVALIQRRLKLQGIAIIADAGGYHYDLGAYHEYVRRAPRGARVADAKFVVIGFDEPGETVPSLEKSIADKVRFLREYPTYSKAPLVKFLLAQQHVHLSRAYAAQKNQLRSDQQTKIAADLYREIVRLYPTSAEADAAKDFLDQTAAK
jgi:hypothetical protein